MVNTTSMDDFVLLGFPGRWEIQLLLFVSFLLIYISAVLENIVIITLLTVDSHLHTPMYFFLGNVSFLEIWYTSITVPKMLTSFISSKNTISYTGCLAQLHFFTFLGGTECLLLAVMAYDRYIAICRPLHYMQIMDHSTCVCLVSGAWLVGFLTPVLPIVLLTRLQFCGPNIINHFFCDFSPLLRLSCSDIHTNEIVDFAVSAVILVSSVLVISSSYFQIVLTVWRMPSAVGRRKAFSTCASHLTVVLVFFGSLSFMYIRVTTIPSFDMNKVVAVFYAVIIPLLNPMIYCLRNREVKEALRRTLQRIKSVTNLR
ncbi:olfactory receptor 6Q1-like [Ambystoma mexicanum]|uniref:olfactory receptor 6Q1-like n=1 Tax=Ambystoma mexicanum TaxID=8296 RepID=UPI0037E85255